MGLEPSIWPLMLASLSIDLVFFEEIEKEGNGDMALSLKTTALECWHLKVEWLH